MNRLFEDQVSTSSLDIFSSSQGKNIANKVIKFANFFISLILLFTIIFLLYFLGNKALGILRFSLENNLISVVHDITYIIVLIKAYRILLFYFRTLHVSLKYIVEICIIAPALEVIFAINAMDITTAIFLGGFSIVNLFMYLFFYEKLKDMDSQFHQH